ncbi:MAG: histidinol dehydrogenase [Gammaproteobacteria bacterium]|nr:histidinol dehydrogenase [Gammaproteobacteria bacterium]
MMLLKRTSWSELDARARQALLQRPACADNAGMLATVRDTLQQVRDGGDGAIAQLTRRFDKVELASSRVDDAELAQAEADLPSDSIAAIDIAIRNVRSFHAAQLPTPIAVETMPGVHCERISQAIDAVGLYVPAGTAPLPSAAIMLAVPAAIAGCPVRILCTPPRVDGRADPAVLVAASRAGIRDIFKIGGAQAIAAMAYGTATVPKVNKIFGPGNAWVTLAKTLVSTDLNGAAIDMPAGPSEVLVIADATASPAFVAADLLAQAEHGVDSQAMLVTTSVDLANRVDTELVSQVAVLSRAETIRAALRNSHCIVAADIDTAIEISNSYAPEHLILQIESARSFVPRIRNAGSIFVGAWSPESAGDYCSGANHVLPTYGFARAYGGLGVEHFLRHTTIQELTANGLAALSETIVTLAELEGLDAHAAAVRVRQGANR